MAGVDKSLTDKINRLEQANETADRLIALLDKYIQTVDAPPER